MEALSTESPGASGESVDVETHRVTGSLAFSVFLEGFCS